MGTHTSRWPSIIHKFRKASDIISTPSKDENKCRRQRFQHSTQPELSPCVSKLHCGDRGCRKCGVQQAFDKWLIIFVSLPFLPLVRSSYNSVLFFASLPPLGAHQQGLLSQSREEGKVGDTCRNQRVLVSGEFDLSVPKSCLGPLLLQLSRTATFHHVDSLKATASALQPWLTSCTGARQCYSTQSRFPKGFYLAAGI